LTTSAAKNLSVVLQKMGPLDRFTRTILYVVVIGTVATNAMMFPVVRQRRAKEQNKGDLPIADK
jgi:hypothetical protein